MSQPKQIFQTTSKLRWNTFKWTGRLLLFFLVLLVPVVWIAMGKVNNILLPGLSKIDTTRNANLFVPKGLSKREQKKYHGYKDFLKASEKKNLLLPTSGRPSMLIGIRRHYIHYKIILMN